MNDGRCVLEGLRGLRLIELGVVDKVCFGGIYDDTKAGMQNRTKR